MHKRLFLAGALATCLATPAFAKKRRSSGRRSSSSGSWRHNGKPASPAPQPPRDARFTMQRTPMGWRTTTLLAVGTILVLDSGEECRVIEVANGYSWCTPLR